MKAWALGWATTLWLGAAVEAAELVGAPAPDFVLKSVSGENLRLSEYRGQIVALSFWATWCGDCRAQLEALAELYSSYADAGLQVLAVSLDTARRQAAATSESLELEYPVLHDVGGAIGRLYEADAMPTIVLIDRDGVVREVLEGYDRGSNALYRNRVRTLLRE
jgi:peroxiredoxin